MLTMIGLACTAGLLYLGTLVMPISIWAMNFALMFALALGIDYALFVVHRFRGALFGHRLSAIDAIAVTMDTAGKAVLFSRGHGADLAVGGDARPVAGVPLDEPRDHARGHVRPRRDAHAAAGRAGRIGPKVDKLALPWAHSGEHRSPRFAAWGERLWRQPVRWGIVAPRSSIGLASRSPSSRRRCPRSRSSRPLTPPTSATSRCSAHSDRARSARCRSLPLHRRRVPPRGSRAAIRGWRR